MKELEMIKAFAELEGVFIEYKLGRYYFTDNGYELKEYSPITDLALNCAARDKYGVTVVYKKYDNCIVKIDGNEGVIGCCVNVELVPSSVIEVILKSKGIWKC